MPLGTRDPHKPGCNLYGVAPIELLHPSPEDAYHATETRNVKAIGEEGLKPGIGEGDYPDTEGKIHVCAGLEGDNTSAVCWARLLGRRKGLTVNDYSIVQLDLRLVPEARLYQDLHSESGIIVDRVESIPAQAIVGILVFTEGGWERPY